MTIAKFEQEQKYEHFAFASLSPEGASKVRTEMSYCGVWK